MDFIRSESIACLRQWIADAKRCAVVSHTHPDGDALGSTAGLALFLQTQGKDVTCLYPDAIAANLRFILPEGLPFHIHNAEKHSAEECILKADLIFLVDANSFSRTEGMESLLKESNARKVLIDHHLNPDTDSFGLVFSTPEISSASEVVYWILKSLLEEGVVPPTVAARPLPVRRASEEALATGPSLLHGRGWPWVGGTTPSSIGSALLTGMTTDTNNFANSVFPSTLQMASELLAAGVDRDAILQQVYQSYRENRVRLMGYMQSEEMKVLPEGGAYMILTKAIQHRFDLQEGESEGLVNVPLSIGKVRLSVLLKEDEGHFRVSVRSKQGTSAQQLAVKYFHGGGHENAAGGKLFIGEDIPSADAAAEYVEQSLKAFLG
ncbi:MAG: DHH family phosphoesterase [Bacteroidales bacterium]|nr:DHH family phosphoesterase [Bacteroidales bacterium]